MKFVLASNNRGKHREMKVVLELMGHEVLSQNEAGFFGEVEETGTTFYENALLKARAVMEATGLPAIADDSGLMVEALDGKPGVHSKRFGGEGLEDEDRNALMLKTLERTEHRAAQFVSLYCVCFQVAISFRRRACAVAAYSNPPRKRRLRLRPDFPRGTGKSTAELTLEEKTPCPTGATPCGCLKSG